MVKTPDTPQPGHRTVVTNTGPSWEVKVPSHHQSMIYGSPLLSRNYRLDHWGSMFRYVAGIIFDSEHQCLPNNVLRI
jgi:hypothetical protein